ncbi:MAG: hypothetical protein WC525_02530 [Candidatus Thermoplasmatota archaeon]
MGNTVSKKLNTVERINDIVGGNQTEKRTIKHSLLIYGALLLCATIDLALSYNYFLYDTELFVTTEANVEFVHFLTQGVFPIHNFLKFILAFPLLLFLLSWFDILRESMQSTTMFFIERCGRIVTVSIPGLFCVSYSCSGVTWYTNSPVIYDILSVLDSLISGCIMIVLCILFISTLYLLLGQEKMMPKNQET